jgi:hypothetical protein
MVISFLSAIMAISNKQLPLILVIPSKIGHLRPVIWEMPVVRYIIDHDLYIDYITSIILPCQTGN